MLSTSGPLRIKDVSVYLSNEVPLLVMTNVLELAFGSSGPIAVDVPKSRLAGLITAKARPTETLAAEELFAGTGSGETELI